MANLFIAVHMHITITNDSLNVYQKFTFSSTNTKKLTFTTNKPYPVMPNYRNDLKKKNTGYRTGSLPVDNGNGTNTGINLYFILFYFICIET